MYSYNETKDKRIIKVYLWLDFLLYGNMIKLEFKTESWV